MEISVVSIAPVTVRAIRRPSGDQSGWDDGWPGVRFRRPEPSARARWTEAGGLNWKGSARA
jgi:hypothetical protein